MELVKPEPLIIGGRAHYTLTSYDPVSIEVDVPYATDEDVDYALQVMVMQSGGGPENLADDAWVQANFEGMSGAGELRAAVRDQVRVMNAQLAEEQKAAKCAEALAKRLVQRVPREQVMQVRQAISQSFALSLQQEGLSQLDFLAQTGMRQDDIEAMLDEQARTSAEQEAAIDAWAEQRKLRVTDDEMPRLLGLTPTEADTFLSEVSAAGQLNQVREAALRNKALEIVVAESNCTYHHETPAEASARVAHMRAEQQAFMQQMGRPEPSEESKHPHLKLV